MTICWREIIPVVKLAHSEPGGVVRVDVSVCECVQVSKVYYFNLMQVMLHFLPVSIYIHVRR